MDAVLGLLVVAGLGAVMFVLVRLGRRVRRRGTSLAVISHADEIFRPATHHARAEVQLQAERRLPPSSADDTYQ
jgi:hypothetical protein